MEMQNTKSVRQMSDGELCEDVMIRAADTEERIITNNTNWDLKARLIRTVIKRWAYNRN